MTWFSWYFLFLPTAIGWLEVTGVSQRSIGEGSDANEILRQTPASQPGFEPRSTLIEVFRRRKVNQR